MENLIMSLITFVIVYLIYLFLIIIRKKKKNKYKNSTEIKYLTTKYNIDINKVNLTVLYNISALSNAFIISITVFVIGFVNELMLKLMVGFIVLFPTILLVYHIIGTNLQKKYGKKE